LYNITDPKELQRFSSHSIRVGAAVTLHTCGKDGEYIKIRLRWRSDTFRLYLRNTEFIADQHNEAVAKILSMFKQNMG
jgi:hypothetical protein